MRILGHRRPKSLAQYLFKNLRKYNFFITKSPRTGKETYYLYSRKKNIPSIRVSNHYLHPNQYKSENIDIVILNGGLVTINNILVPADNIIKHKVIILDYVIERINLMN